MSGDFKEYMQTSYKYNFLTEEKEKELSEKMVNGSKAAREELIKCHLRMVFPIAKKFQKNGSIPLEDLIQEGNLGLITAADHFDPEKQIRFAAYARWWVAEFIKRKFYKEVYIVKTPLRVVQKSFKLKNDTNELGREKKKGENKAIVNIVKKPLYLGDCIQHSKRKNTDKELQWENMLKDKRHNPEEKVELDELKNYLNDQVTNFLNENEKLILTKRYLQPDERLTYKNLGKSLNISSETVRNIEKRAINKLKKRLKKDFSYL